MTREKFSWILTLWQIIALPCTDAEEYDRMCASRFPVRDEPAEPEQGLGASRAGCNGGEA